MGAATSITRIDNSSAWLHLFRACRSGDADALRVQLRTAASGVHAVDDTGATALMWAAACG